MNRDIGNPSDVRRQNLPDYSPCEAANAVNKYASYLEGASVVLLSAREAVSTPGNVTCDQRCTIKRQPPAEVGILCSSQCDGAVDADRLRRMTRIGLRVLALLLVVLGIVPNHVIDGAGWALLVAFALGWFSGDLWGYSCSTASTVYKTIADQTSLRWSLVLLFTGVAAVLASLLILTHVAEQDWASVLSVVLGWLTGRHYHRCRASFGAYLDRFRMAEEV